METGRVERRHSCRRWRGDILVPLFLHTPAQGQPLSMQNHCRRNDPIFFRLDFTGPRAAGELLRDDPEEWG